LAPAAPGVSGEEDNLYRYDTSTETTSYIATVNKSDYLAVVGDWAHLPNTGQEIGLDVKANWDTTGDGRFLLFASQRNIAGYDSAQAPGADCLALDSSSPDGHCAEIYRYSVEAEERGESSIVCVSCAPDGSASVANAEFERSTVFGDPAGAPVRAISEDGSYAFFDTENVLVPGAKIGELHVYEWHDGTISLLSAPQDPSNSFFMGASADGSNVFLGTHAQLLSQDTDGSGDLYDARIDGGFSPVTPPLCTGTGCQGVPAAPPIFATPSSVTFEGVGNFPSPSGAVLKPKAKGLTNAQKLKAALRVCRRDRVKHKRVRCETRAEARYAQAQWSIKSNRGGK
jgi:hypothetical protein